MIVVLRLWQWVRSHAAAVLGAVAAVLGAVLLAMVRRRQPTQASTPAPVVAAAREAGRAAGAAEVLEQQAVAVDVEADQLESELTAEHARPAEPPLTEDESDADVARKLTARGL